MPVESQSCISHHIGFKYSSCLGPFSREKYENVDKKKCTSFFLLILDSRRRVSKVLKFLVRKQKLFGYISC